MRLSVCIFFLLCSTILSRGDDNVKFTSPVLRKNMTNYLTFAGKTYYVGNVFRANFYRALQFCRQLGMQLVSINSMAENNKLGSFVEEIGSANGHFWTSATNLGDKNQWIWLSTGHNIVYTNWDRGEPNGLTPAKVNQSENCVEVRNFGKGFAWNDLNCFADLFFICESSSDCSRK